MALLAAYTIVLTDEGLLAQRALVKREAELRSLIAEADGRIRVLEWDNDHMETTLERRARQDYDMVRPNELIYRNGEADSARAGASPGIAPRSEPR
jgi:cell division protein FtsB